MKKKVILLISLALLALGSIAFSKTEGADVNEYGKCGPSGCCGYCQVK